MREKKIARDSYVETLLARRMNGFVKVIAGNWRFEQATPDQLNNVEIDEEGLHWPDIDEDLSFAGLLRGDYGQHMRKISV